MNVQSFYIKSCTDCSVKTFADRTDILLIVTSVSGKLFNGVNIDDLE